jgi:8-oxo-dGTP pyrophosphatase MutT (NUDIX family)
MHRIRVSLLISRGNRLLFVNETAEPRVAELDIDPDRTGFWQLPGGGLEPGESVHAAALREAREETGLSVQPERIVYVQEYVNPIEPFYQVEFIVAAAVLDGRPTVPDDDNVVDLRLLCEQERSSYNIVPWHDRDVIWSDLRQGFPQFRHLGVDTVQGGTRPRLHTEPFAPAGDAEDGP